MQTKKKILLIPAEGVVGVDQLAPETLSRLQAGLKLWQTGRYDLIVVSGGIFLPQEIQTIAAAKLMKSWLVKKGVDDKSILCEDKSLDTFENISLSLEKINSEGIKNFAIDVISQWQHAIRFCITFLLAHQMWVRPRASSWNNVWSEWLFVPYHLFDWKGTMLFARKNRDERRRK